MADVHMTNCAYCGDEIEDTEVCSCDDCGLEGVCEDCYSVHECDDEEFLREID